MRYIILFIVAILLPIFAFLNFSQKKGEDFSVMPPKQRASLSLSSTESEKKLIESTSTDGALEEVFEDTAEKVVTEERKITKINEVFELNTEIIGADTGVTVLPQPEPIRFPLSTTASHLYLEKLRNPNFLPIRNWDTPLQDIKAFAALALEPLTQKVLYHKNIFELRPIASLTKLMTALVVIEEMNLTSTVIVSQNDVATYGEQGDLRPDERISVENLLYMLLIVSSNDAAVALEEYYNAFRTEQDKTFVAAMNARAQKLGLRDTFFVEPSGLNVNNRSTAYDIARLADHVFQRPILRQIMSTKTIDVQSADGLINHHLINSNKLLGVLEGVLGGKTGYTEEAGESILLFVKKSDAADDYLIYTILGSDDRARDARELIRWVDKAYVWK